jgi:hypothetical protein
MTDRPDWDDVPMDARLRDLAKEYNRPRGEVPRDAMWQAIAPAMRAARMESAPDIIPLASTKRRHIAPYAWGAALAAGLVLGIMLEREVLAPRAPMRSATTRAASDIQHVAITVPESASTRQAEGTSTPRAPLPKNPLPSATSRVATRDDQVPSLRSSSSVPNDVPSAANADSASQRLYRLAARQTLVQAEALLTSYRAGSGNAADQESVRQAGRWARDVLTSTRLLLDSPAAKDPQFRALFTDLELVLAQLVQLSGAPLDAGERELIERAMRDRDLLPRLRSALPAGAATE